MIRLKLAVACLAVSCSFPHAGSAMASTTPSRSGIDVMTPVEGSPWSGERMRDARDRLKDIVPGKRD